MDPLKDNQDGAANGGTTPIATEAEATEKAIAEAKANAEAAEAQAQEKAAAEAAAKAATKNAGKTSAKKKVAINFVIKKFNLDGIVYNSSQVEEAAKAGDVAALKLIEQLVEMKSQVIEIVNQ